MRYFLGVSMLAFMLGTGCGNNANKPTEQSVQDTIAFYPLNQFLDSQIADVVQTPYFIYKTVTISGKKDSSVISPEEFKMIANEFVTADIADASFKKHYKETAFHDGGIQTITFNYTTPNPELPIRSADILLDETSQRVRRIFISKAFTRSDSSFEMKLGWKPDENFFINKKITPQKGKPYTEQLKVIWNEKGNNK